MHAQLLRYIQIMSLRPVRKQQRLASPCVRVGGLFVKVAADKLLVVHAKLHVILGLFRNWWP